MTKYFSTLSLMVGIVTLAALSSPARAERQNACKDDIQKFCSDVDPQRSQSRSCLLEDAQGRCL